MTTSIIITGATKNDREREISKIISERNIVSGNVMQDSSEKMGIAEVRSWQTFLSTTSGSTKLLVVHNAEILTIEAQNAFLKTLEEPPENSVIILESEGVTNFLPTIISRCVIIDLGTQEMEFTTEEKEKMEADLKLGNLDIGSKFALAQKISSNRTEAIVWTDSMIKFLHQTRVSDKFEWIKIKKLLRTKKHLKANTNVRLAMENLFLNW